MSPAEDDPAIAYNLRVALRTPPLKAPLLTIVYIAGALADPDIRPDTTAYLLTYVLDYTDTHPDGATAGPGAFSCKPTTLLAMYADTPDLPPEVQSRLLLTLAVA